MEKNGEFLIDNRSKQSLLIDLDSRPRDVWPQILSPWEYNPLKISKSKRQSLIGDTTSGKNTRTQGQEGKKQNNIQQGVKEKKLLTRKGFIFHSDIRSYIREYRENRKKMASEYKNCSCHSSYTNKDIKKMYESLARLPKPHDSKRRGQRKKLVIASMRQRVKSDKVVKDEGEDDSELCDLPVIFPSGYQDFRRPEYNELQSMTEKTNEETSLENLVDRRLGRRFYAMEWQGSPCPVVSLTLPESHDVRRVSDNGSNEISQRRKINDSPSSSTSRDERQNLSRTDFDTSFSSRGSSFLAVSPFDMTETSTESTTMKSSSTKHGSLSAKIRDFRPFSRNGLATRVTKAAKEKRKRSTFPCVDGKEKGQDIDKQAIPWKILSYLGYNQSMRRYLHEIYTPIGRHQSNSPLLLSTKTYLKGGHVQSVATEWRDSRKNFDKPKPISSVPFGGKFVETGSRRQYPFTEVQKRAKMAEYENVYPEKHPKLAILPKFETVVKSKVSIRGFFVT